MAKMKVMTLDFDVAFVNLGILSTPLCYFISKAVIQSTSLKTVAFS